MLPDIKHLKGDLQHGHVDLTRNKQQALTINLVHQTMKNKKQNTNYRRQHTTHAMGAGKSMTEKENEEWTGSFKTYQRRERGSRRAPLRPCRAGEEGQLKP